MADQALRAACTTIANQLFSFTPGHLSSSDEANPNPANTTTQRRLQATASQVSDAAMSLCRLCTSQAHGGPVTIGGSGVGSMEEAAHCVCAVVRAAHPRFWLALTSRAAILHPRHPALRLGEPTPLPMSLKEIERFAGRSQRLVERLVKSPLPSAPQPSSSSLATWEDLSVAQAEQLAVCYYWSVTTPAEKRKHSKQGGLFEVSTPSAHPPKRTGGGGRDKGTMDSSDAAAAEESEEAEGTRGSGGYRRDRLWPAHTQPPALMMQSADVFAASPDASAQLEPANAASATAVPAASGRSGGPPPLSSSHAGAASEGTVRHALKRLRDDVAEPEAFGEEREHDSTGVINADHNARLPPPPPRAGALSKALAAQARLYDDNCTPLLTGGNGAERDEIDQGARIRARTEHGSDEDDADTAKLMDTGAPAERRHRTRRGDRDATPLSGSLNDGKCSEQVWQQLVDVFAAPAGTETPEEENIADGVGVEGSAEPSPHAPTTTPSTSRLAISAAQLLRYVLTPPAQRAFGGGAQMSAEDLCAKVELVKAHLYWQRLERCVGHPLWLSARRYARAPAETVPSPSADPSASSPAAPPLAPLVSWLYTQVGSSYHHAVPLPDSPPAACAVPRGGVPSPAAGSQAHFLAPGRMRFGVGLDISGPLLASRATSLVTAPLLWTRLLLCAAWLRSYATVYLPTVLAERVAELDRRRPHSSVESVLPAVAEAGQSGRARLFFDPSTESVCAQQSTAAYCLSVVQDAYSRFHGGLAPPPPSPRRAGEVTAAHSRRSASSSQPPRTSSKTAACPVCEGLTRQAPPILCGALREDRTVLQRHLRTHHLPSRGADPHCLTPLLASGTGLVEATRNAWQAWSSAASAPPPSSSDGNRADPPAHTDQTTKVIGTLEDLHLRMLARRLHALVESLVGLQQLGKLRTGVEATDTMAVSAPSSGSATQQARSPAHTRQAGDLDTDSAVMPAPSQPCSPDLLPLAALDAVCGLSQQRRHTTAAMGAGRSASAALPGVPDGVGVAKTVLALYDAYGWAAAPLFAPFFRAASAPFAATAAGPHARLASVVETVTTPTPPLWALTDIVVGAVAPWHDETTAAAGAVTDTVSGQQESGGDGLTPWQRCALIWHNGELCTTPLTPSQTPSSPSSLQDADACIDELHTVQTQLLAWLNVFPSVPLLREEDGVLECERCFTLFHQNCVCPSQRDLWQSQFLCHACRIREAT